MRLTRACLCLPCFMCRSSAYEGSAHAASRGTSSVTHRVLGAIPTWQAAVQAYQPEAEPLPYVPEAPGSAGPYQPEEGELQLEQPLEPPTSARALWKH